MGKIQGAVVKQNNAVNKAPKTIQGYVKMMLPEISKALPSVMTPERFTRITLSALSSNPKLCDCTPDSFLGAMMSAAQLGLEPNTPLGQAYLIPFNNNRKRCVECQFQLGYKGLIDLAYRSGEVSVIQAHTVYENDTFEYELGLDPRLRHIPAMSNRGKPIAYYAMFKTKDGGNGFSVMSIEDIEQHARRYSKSYGSGPWQTDFDAMAKKTVLKQCLKYAPLKSEFVRAVAADNTVRDTNQGITAFEDADLIQANFETVETEEDTSDSGMSDEEKREAIEREQREAALEREAEEVL